MELQPSQAPDAGWPAAPTDVTAQPAGATLGHL